MKIKIFSLVKLNFQCFVFISHSLFFLIGLTCDLSKNVKTVMF